MRRTALAVGTGFSALTPAPTGLAMPRLGVYPNMPSQGKFMLDHW